MDPGFTHHQLHLNVSIREDATLNNFYLSADSKNAEVIATLKQQLPTKQGAIFYLWGASSSGLTHLLHGACHFAKSQSQASVYLPLAEVSGYEPYALLEGLENNQLVCLDDLHKVTGNQQWEQAIFDLYNRILESNHHLIVSANQGPHELTILLPDLRSRLSAGHSYQIQA